MLHPELQALRKRAEAVGMVAVDHGDHICLRLSLFCSVRIRYDGERLTFEPRYGAVSRVASSTLLYGVSIAAVVYFNSIGAALGHQIMAGAFTALAGTYEAIRYVITEAAITRATILWTASRPSLGMGESPAALSAPAAERIPVERPLAQRETTP